MPHGVNAENGLPACKPVLEVVRGHSGWYVTTEDSLIVMHGYAIAIGIASSAEILNVHGQVVSTRYTIIAAPCRRRVSIACLKEKWCHSGSKLPKENKEESDAHARTNVLCCPCATAYNRTPVVDQVSMTLRMS